MAGTPDFLARPDVALAVFLVLGHVVADFLFQTSWMVEQKDSKQIFGLHVGIVFASHLVCLLPVVGIERDPLLIALFCAAALAVVHALIDSGKVWWLGRDHEDSLGLFGLDQLAHGLSLVGAWFGLKLWVGEWALKPEGLEVTTAIALVVTGYVLNGTAAAALIKLFLQNISVGAPSDDTEMDGDATSRGRIIGILERMILFSLIVLGQWEATSWVLAIKTATRFQEMDDKDFSEYYLIGTLSSFLFAAVTGFPVRFLLGDLLTVLT